MSVTISLFILFSMSLLIVIDCVRSMKKSSYDEYVDNAPTYRINLVVFFNLTILFGCAFIKSLTSS